MTKEEIIEMVKQTDLLGIIDSQYYENEKWVSDVVEFAKLVAEHEREACASLAEEYANGLERNYSEIIADNIRARGKELSLEKSL